MSASEPVAIVIFSSDLKFQICNEYFSRSIWNSIFVSVVETSSLREVQFSLHFEVSFKINAMQPEKLSQNFGHNSPRFKGGCWMG